MSQQSPAGVPVKPAATVIVVDDRPDLHVLCLQRRQGSAFVGGMTVFPGGGLDEEDHAPAYAQRSRGLAPDEADRILGVDRGGLAWWVAAVRETFEEAGVLLARGRDGAPPSPAALAARREVDQGACSLLSVLEAHDLELDLGQIRAVARWITPEGPPRRYDTRFFVAAMPTGQKVAADEVEAVDAHWCRPAEALEARARGERSMLPPTVCLLGVLARFGRVGPLLEAARRSRGPGRRARLLPGDGTYRILLPGEDGYEDPEARDVAGWVHDL